MQIFLPYSDFKTSLRVLDYKRLGKQRVEAMQIINLLEGKLTKKGTPYRSWKNHPVSKMWAGYIPALKEYTNLCIIEWIRRGYVNNMIIYDLSEKIEYPPWLGNKKFHSLMRSTLLFKDYEYYKIYNWSEKPSDISPFTTEGLGL